jgi:hypothetical protein
VAASLGAGILIGLPALEAYRGCGFTRDPQEYTFGSSLPTYESCLSKKMAVVKTSRKNLAPVDHLTSRVILRSGW